MRKIGLTLTFMIVVVFSMQSQPGAIINFTEEEHDFGVIKEVDGRVSYKFEFKNTGQAPLIIHDVDASCGCTTPEWTREPVMPGQIGFINAIYDPKNRPGMFEKTITISSNSQTRGKYILKITGEVIPKGMPQLQ